MEYQLAVRVDEERQLSAVLNSPDAVAARHLVVLVHGGPGGQKDGPDGLFRDLASHLCDSGLASLRFDFAGAGDSSGNYREMTIGRQVEELEAIWGFAKSLGFERLFCVAESFGATALLASQLVPDSTVLLWPAIDLLDLTFASFVTDEKLAVARTVGFTVEDGIEIGVAFLEELLHIETVRPGLLRLSSDVLFIHGSADTEVPVRQSRRAVEELGPRAKLIEVAGGDHCLAESYERDIVNSEVTRFLLGS